MKFLVVVCALLSICSAQTRAPTSAPVTDCAALNLGNSGNPFSVDDTSACARYLGTNPQCCSPMYLRTTVTMTTDSAFKQAIGKVFEARGNSVNILRSNIEYYLSDRYLRRFTENIPYFGSLDSTAQQNIITHVGSLATNLEISSDTSSFDEEAFVNNLIDMISQASATSFTSTNQQATCLREAITSVTRDKTSLIAKSIKTVRRSATSLSRIANFLSNYKTTAMNTFQAIQGCRDRLTEYSFCPRCTQVRPPLCQADCSALVRGCLSPIFTALERDFEQLRTVSMRILNQLSSIIRETFVQEQQLIDTMALGTAIRTCLSNGGAVTPTLPTGPGGSLPTLPSGPFTLPSGVTFPTPPSVFTLPPGFDFPFTQPNNRPTLAPDFTFSTRAVTLPNGVTLPDFANEDSERTFYFQSFNTLLNPLSGPFIYGDDGMTVDFCRPTSVETNRCMQPSGTRSNTDRSCAVDSVCVSKCDCWDGDNKRMSDDDTTPFRGGNRVIDQMNNRAVDGLTEELDTQLNIIGTMTPANAFLTSNEFTAVVPDGIAIPTAEPFVGGATTTIVSLCAMVLLTLIAIVL